MYSTCESLIYDHIASQKSEPVSWYILVLGTDSQARKLKHVVCANTKMTVDWDLSLKCDKEHLKWTFYFEILFQHVSSAFILQKERGDAM